MKLKKLIEESKIEPGRVYTDKDMPPFQVNEDGYVYTPNVADGSHAGTINFGKAWSSTQDAHIAKIVLSPGPLGSKVMLTEDKKQANVQLDLSQAETILCEQCQNGLFLASFFLKRISALVSPTGKEAIIPIQVYSCGNCGEIPELFLSELD